LNPFTFSKKITNLSFYKFTSLEQYFYQASIEK
jgi:hypothetical protein